jgi:hypothetical protein
MTGDTVYVWTCPDCGFCAPSWIPPPPGTCHITAGNCFTAWSYVEVGTVAMGVSGRYYLKLPPPARRKRRSA